MSPRPGFTARERIVIAALAASILGAVSYFPLGGSTRGEPPPSEDQIHAMGEQLAGDIEAWRAKAGRYPATLKEAGLSSPTAYQGGFTYDSDAAGFGLRIGFANGTNYLHVYTSKNFRKSGHSPGWYCMD